MKKIPTVLIIGGTSGIGLATAIRFSKNHTVIVVGSDSIKGEYVQTLPNIIFMRCDITIQSQRENLLNNVQDKKISKIIHCAGIFNQNDDSTYQNKYRAVKFGGIEIIKQLLINATITHVCATSSLYTFLPDTIVPVFEKLIQQKLEALIFSIPKSVIANCIAPGLTNTPLIQHTYGEMGIKKVLSFAPGSRIVEPEEIAEAIYWLSNQSTISRSVIPIDGGFLQYFNKNQSR